MKEVSVMATFSDHKVFVEHEIWEMSCLITLHFFFSFFKGWCAELNTKKVAELLNAILTNQEYNFIPVISYQLMKV